jgi:uncharacterized protein
MRPEDQIDICSVRSDSDDGHKPITPRAFKTQKPAIAERHWVRGDPFATALFNAFSAVFPHGETFMVRSIKPWQIRMPAALARDVSNFVKQEAAHAREHGNMNRSLIDAGYDIEPLERTIRGFVAFFRNSSELSCLGVTMGIEHFTAIIAAEILKNDHHLEGASAELRELWLWHGIEEIEHKAVAFDVWQYATRNWSPLRKYLVRSGIMTAITISFLINRTRGQMELLRQDGYGKTAAFIGLIKAGFGKGGVARNIFKPWLNFFRPSFHPWDHDDRALLAKGEKLIAEFAASRAAQQPMERRKGARFAKAA